MIAIIQNDAKRLIAYSSLSHVGLITAGMMASAILTVNGNFLIVGGEGALIQSFAHGINVVGLFVCADVLYRRFKTRDIRKMGGLAKVAPKFAILFLILVLGSIALPLTNGFIGEFILIKSIFDYSTAAAVIAGLTMIFSSAYMFRFYAKAMLGPIDEVTAETATDVSATEFSVLASHVVFVILLGIFPQIILNMVDSPLRFIFNQMLP